MFPSYFVVVLFLQISVCALFSLSRCFVLIPSLFSPTLNCAAFVQSLESIFCSGSWSMYILLVYSFSPLELVMSLVVVFEVSSLMFTFGLDSSFLVYGLFFGV